MVDAGYDQDKLIAAGYRLMRFDLETGRQVWALLVEECPEGNDRWSVVEIAPVDAIVRENAALRSASAGQRYGDGAVVARVPEHILHNRLMPAIQQGDQKWLARWLNDSDHAAFRVRDGRI